MRYNLNVKTGKIITETLIDYEIGVGDVPNYNSKYEYKKNKYSYILESWTPNILDENYAWPIAKFDEDSKKVISRWGKMVASQEPRFIPNPNGTDEDDGLILTMARNFDTSTSSLYFIDPKTMKTLQEYRLPFGHPLAVHNSFWSDYTPPSNLQDDTFI